MCSAASKTAGRTAERTGHVVADRPASEAIAEEALAAVDLRWSPSGTCAAVDDDPVPGDVRTSRGRPLPAGSIVIDPTSTTGFSTTAVSIRAPKNRQQLRLLVTMRDQEPPVPRLPRRTPGAAARRPLRRLSGHV